MHCVCEGVIDQLLAQWLDKSNSKKAFYLGSVVEKISQELTAITPTCDVTHTPRSLADVKDWKGTLVKVLLNKIMLVVTEVHTFQITSDILFEKEITLLASS